MAMSTAGTYLYYKSVGEGTPADFKKLCDITNYPDMGSTPSKLDTTDLSCLTYKTSILGLQDLPELTFEAWFTKEQYTTLQSLKNKLFIFELRFGEEGVDGKFTWQGEVVSYVKGAGVDEVRGMTLVLSAETEPVFG